jgi:hypothetical protein
LIVESDNRIASISFKYLDRITVCQPVELPLSSGDRLQLKANGRSEDNRKLANGELVTVKEVREDGRIALADGRVLPSRFRQFVRGYAVTSYASQGKTVDHVLFSDSAVKAATNQQQWYVTVSRGRKGVEIFTTDKQQLREQITRSGDRPLAMGLTPKTRNSWFHQAIEQRYGPRAANILSKRRQASIHSSASGRDNRQRCVNLADMASGCDMGTLARAGRQARARSYSSRERLLLRVPPPSFVVFDDRWLRFRRCRELMDDGRGHDPAPPRRSPPETAAQYPCDEQRGKPDRHHVNIKSVVADDGIQPVVKRHCEVLRMWVHGASFA